MSGGAVTWPRVKLGEVLTRSTETVEPNVETEYQEITVRMWGKGVVERGRVLGASVNGRRFVARAGQFIASRIDARNGAMGLVPDTLDGALVTNDFPLFDVKAERLAPGYLQWLCRTASFVELCQRASEGTTNRVRLKEGEFVALEVPLPPLPEQQRIVAQIDESAMRVGEAQRLQDAVAAEADDLCRALLRDAPEAVLTPLREIMALRSPDVSVRADESYHFAGVYCFGRGVFVGNAKTGMEFAYRKLTRLRAGDFIYPKLMAWEGAFGVVPPKCDGLVVSTEFPVFEVDRNRVLPEVLDVYFRNPALWSSIGGASTGTNVRRRRLNPQEFLDLRLPLPAMARQQLLAETCAEVSRIKAAQTESRKMLEALLPAILDRAFAGAL